MVLQVDVAHEHYPVGVMPGEVVLVFVILCLPQVVEGLSQLLHAAIHVSQVVVNLHHEHVVAAVGVSLGEQQTFACPFQVRQLQVARAHVGLSPGVVGYALEESSVVFQCSLRLVHAEQCLCLAPQSVAVVGGYGKRVFGTAETFGVFPIAQLYQCEHVPEAAYERVLVD